MRKYKTGYVAYEDEIGDLKDIIGRFFSVHFYPVEGDKNTNYKFEAVVNTKDYQNARLATQLIASALSLIDGCAFFTLDSLPNLVPLQNDEIDVEIPEFGPVSVSRSDIPSAIKIATKSTYLKKNYRSLLKYQIGCELHSNDFMDLYPVYYQLSRNPADHIRLSYAIIVFYSILEELGLEIRASSIKPSKINGEWNPKVKYNLEERLSKSKIDILQKINWNLRSTPTKIEKLSKPTIGRKSKWAKSFIRDSEITIIDAIAQASWLRSRIASHKISDAFTSLSIYDVANVDFLTRHILLEILNMEWIV